VATRRDVLQMLAAGSAAMIEAPHAAAQPETKGTVVRVSKGRFEPDRYAIVRQRLDESKRTLVPAIRALRGCLHFWAGVDLVSNTLVNVSIWASIDDARQMETLAPMRALAVEFAELGVTFERPIANYESLWEI
jgi:hypothetical protein